MSNDETKANAADGQSALNCFVSWLDEFNGLAECREYGFWAKLVKGKGWVPCDRDEQGATEDLNRLVVTCKWDRNKLRFVLDH